MTSTQLIRLEQKATASEDRVERLLANVDRIEREDGISHSPDLDKAEKLLQTEREALEITHEELYQQRKSTGNTHTPPTHNRPLAWSLHSR